MTIFILNQKMQGKKHYELNEVGSQSFSAQPGYTYSQQNSLVGKCKKFKYILILIAIVAMIAFFVARKIWWNIMSDNDKHRHDDWTFPYPTVGIPVPNHKYNATKVTNQQLATFDETLLELLKPYNDTDCEFARYGDMDQNYGGEGGYLICNNWIQNSKGIVNVGINGFDAFGCQVSTVGNFMNYQYDCMNSIETSCTNQSRNMMNSICFGAATEEHYGKQYQTFQKILQENRLENKHVILKIDCEGCEYPGLKFLPMDLLDNVDQIVGEWHFWPIYTEEWGMLDIIRSLNEKFVMVNLHMTNFACTDQPHRRVKALAMEYTMVNKRLITKRSESQSYALHRLNKPSFNANRDCQIE